MDQHAADVWNRASMSGTVLGVSPGTLAAGTRKLADLLRFHNAVMSGGLASAVEASSDELLNAAAEASRYLELSELNRFLVQIAAISRDYEAIEDLDDQYARLTEEDVVGDGAIYRAFEAKLAVAPADFEDGGSG
jgi:hypothetical protein